MDEKVVVESNRAFMNNHFLREFLFPTSSISSTTIVHKGRSYCDIK